MRRITHDTYATIIGVAYLGLMTNMLLLIGCLPLVVLLITTDPSLSWPLLAVAAPLCAPAIAAAFSVFRDHSRGGGQVIRVFLSAWKATARRSLVLGTLVTAVVVVALVDVRAVSASELSVVFVPVLGLVAVVAVAVGLVGLAAVSEEPRARLRDVVRAAAYLALRRWYLTAVSLAVLAVQFALFTTLPAIALGLSAAPALYLAWANSRFTLRPVLETDEVAAV